MEVSFRALEVFSSTLHSISSLRFHDDFTCKVQVRTKCYPIFGFFFFFFFPLPSQIKLISRVQRVWGMRVLWAISKIGFPWLPRKEILIFGLLSRGWNSGYSQQKDGFSKLFLRYPFILTKPLKPLTWDKKTWLQTKDKWVHLIIILR